MLYCCLHIYSPFITRSAFSRAIMPRIYYHAPDDTIFSALYITGYYRFAFTTTLLWFIRLCILLLSWLLLFGPFLLYPLPLVDWIRLILTDISICQRPRRLLRPGGSQPRVTLRSSCDDYLLLLVVPFGFPRCIGPIHPLLRSRFAFSEHLRAFPFFWLTFLYPHC